MLAWISRFRRHLLFGSPALLQQLLPLSSACSAIQVLGFRETQSRSSCKLSHLNGNAYHIHNHSGSIVEEAINPFSLVAHELSLISERLRSMVVAEVPELSTAAEYFFRSDVEGKKMCPTVLLLMAKSFGLNASDPSLKCRQPELREGQWRLAEITEIFHVTSLIHDDVLDEAGTRRGISSLNFVMGNKSAVLAGDFLLFRAFGALALLKNTEAVSLMAAALKDLVTGEIMQMTSTSDKRCSMEFYMRKTYNKTAALISNSCKAMALLSGQTEEVAEQAFEYGKNLGLAYQFVDDILDFTATSASLGKASLSDIKNGIITAPMLFAMEEFPQLRGIVDAGFEDPANLDTALEYLRRSNGIQRTKQLATMHSELAAAAINSLPKTMDEDARKAREALRRLTQMIITRKK